MRRTSDRSIRRQLLWWLLIPLSGIWIISAVVTYNLALSYADELYDNELLDSVDSVVARIRKHDSTIDVDIPPAVLAVFRHNDKDKFFFQLLTTDGKFLVGESRLPAPRFLPQPNSPYYGRTNFLKDDFRTVAMRAAVEGAPGTEVIVYVAETLHQRRALANHILINTLLSQLIVILSGSAAVWYGVARGLKQLESIKWALARRSQADLSPLDEDDAPVEVRPLVHAINDLMDRLRYDLEAQRRFVANAAHQLRTPLAGLKTYIGYLKKMVKDRNAGPVLEQLDNGTDRTTHLVNRLLSLARVEPNAGVPNNYRAVDLNFPVSEATSSLAPEAISKDIELSFEASEVPALIHGDISNLQELVTNIVENAVRYTQHGGNVTVRVVEGDPVELVVEDNGPGIPAGERERVFERFYRILGTGIPGSGLGLSIVSEIARAHNARVLIQDGKDGCGTRVVVEFMRGSRSDSLGHGDLEHRQK